MDSGLIDSVLVAIPHYQHAEYAIMAMKKGLHAFALTDHDTVDGLEEAMNYAQELKKSCLEKTENNQGDLTMPLENVPEIIPGIEFSTEYQGRDVHILGLYILAPCNSIH